MGTDSPLLAYDNQLGDYAIITGIDSNRSPLTNAWNRDTSRPAFPKSDGLGTIALDFGTNKACDTLLLGASRHSVGGNRFAGGSLKVEVKTAAGTLTEIHNAAITAPANHAFIEKLTAHTPILPGLTWNDETVTLATGRNVRWVHDRFVAVGLGDCYVSTDGGDTWVTNAIVAATQFWDIAFGADTFVAVGAGGAVYTSSDTTTWTPRTYPHAGVIYSITYDGTQFIAVGASGETATSPDGITWTSRTQAVATDLRDVKANGGLITAVGASGEVVTSSDGITWTQETTPAAGLLYALDYIVDRWIAVGAAGFIMSSFDGATWEQLTSPTGSDLYCIESDGTIHRASGASGVTIISTDQEAWITDTAITTTLTYGMATNGVMWIACKASGLFSNFYKFQYRITLSGLAVSSDIAIPEMFLGPRLEMPFLEVGFDPYNEVAKSTRFEAENGRVSEQLRYRRVEMNPSWGLLDAAQALLVDDFRENAVETRTPFWFAWKPDTANEEVYLFRHSSNSATMPFKTPVFRSFKLKLVEAI